MKRIVDIYSPDELEEELQISSSFVRDKIVVGKQKHKNTSDVREGKSDIIFKSQKNIILSKKKGKCFDALERKSVFRNLYEKKILNLSSKGKGFSFYEFYKNILNYLKNISLRGGIIALSFGIIFICVGLFGLKLLAENRVNAGYEKLLSLKDSSSNIEDIQKIVNNARFDFFVAHLSFSPFRLIPGEKIDSVNHVVQGGKHLSKGLDKSLSLYQDVYAYMQDKNISSIYFTELFSSLQSDFVSIENDFAKSVGEYQEISWLPNLEVKNLLDENLENLEEIQQYLASLNTNFEDFLNILGDDRRKRYLIVFQNADEIRPTGGFMGSMGLLEVFKGRVQLFQKKDVYAIEWDLKSADYERLPAPKGIDRLTDTFGLRDANYFVNLKDSSENIRFFTERAGLDIDGVVYINQSSLLSMLELTGPIYFPALERDITAENFSEIMSLVVEAKTFKEGTLGTPKQVLFDFIEIYKAYLLENPQYFEYARVLMHELRAREIMFWSFQDDERQILRDFDLTAEINYGESLDFAYPFYTSLSGNKSDRYMKRSYTQTVTAVDACAYEVNFEIKSTHDMGQLTRDRVQGLIDEFSLESPNLFKIQGADTNRQLVRVILPHDAIISPQAGMEIVDYGSRKGVEFFLDTELQQSSFYNIEYSLLNPNCTPYSYKLYKQAGIPRYDININIDDEIYQYTSREEDFYFEER